jgi:hypothetical protein
MKLKGKAKAAFLRKMAAGRKRAARKHGLSKAMRKHRASETPKARKKRKAVGRRYAKKRKHLNKERHVAKKRHHSKKKGHGRRRHHASVSKWLPDQHRLVGMGSAFAYGKVEAAASKDQAHFLNKVPPVVAQIGRAGNLGAILWLGGVVLKHPVVKSVASGVLHVAAYQNGRGGGFTKDSPDFKMGAPHRPGRGRDEMLVEQYLNRHRNG